MNIAARNLGGPVGHRVKRIARLDLPGGGQVTVKNGIAYLLDRENGLDILGFNGP